MPTVRLATAHSASFQCLPSCWAGRRLNPAWLWQEDYFTRAAQRLERRVRACPVVCAERIDASKRAPRAGAPEPFASKRRPIRTGCRLLAHSLMPPPLTPRPSPGRTPWLSQVPNVSEASLSVQIYSSIVLTWNPHKAVEHTAPLWGRFRLPCENDERGTEDERTEMEGGML